MIQNIDDMTFGEAFKHCRSEGLRSMNWRGTNYRIDLVYDVAIGFDRQLELECAKRKPFRTAYDRALARIDYLETCLSLKREGSEVPPAPDDPDFADIAPAPEGRMISDKPIGQLRIERQKNGGWLVDGRDLYDHPSTRSDVSGAFTNTDDMLRALADLLEQDDKKREEKADG